MTFSRHMALIWPRSFICYQGIFSPQIPAGCKSLNRNYSQSFVLGFRHCWHNYAEYGALPILSSSQFFSTLSIASPLANCLNYRIAGVTFYNIFTASTLLLSYIRVCAVWNRSKAIVATFGFLWLASLAGSLTTVGGITNFSVGDFCAERTAGDYVAAAILAPTINHIIVFLTITYGLCRSRSQASLLDLRRGYKLYILGDTLPAFSKALLQTSQLCYLYVRCHSSPSLDHYNRLLTLFNRVVVLIGIFTMAWFFGYGTDPGYRIAIFNPYAAIVNIMFSWVFRKAKLGVFTIIAPTTQDVTPNTIGLRGMRNIQSAPVLDKPAAVFRSTKDLESNNEESLHTRTGSSLRGYESYGDQEPFEYNIQSAVNTAPPVKIGVEQVVELVSDTTTSSGAGGKRALPTIPQYHY